MTSRNTYKTRLPLLYQLEKTQEHRSEYDSAVPVLHSTLYLVESWQVKYRVELAGRACNSSKSKPLPSLEHPR